MAGKNKNKTKKKKKKKNDAPADPDAPRIKLVVQNRRARHDYAIEKTFEAGLVLKGSEVKSLREGRMAIAQSFCRFDDQGELWLEGSHVSEYKNASYFGHEPERRRKLLMHARELQRLRQRVEQQGYALVPTKVYFKNGVAKVELALGKGRRKGDRREAARREADKADARRAMRKSARSAHARRGRDD